MRLVGPYSRDEGVGLAIRRARKDGTRRLREDSDQLPVTSEAESGVSFAHQLESGAKVRITKFRNYKFGHCRFFTFSTSLRPVDTQATEINETKGTPASFVRSKSFPMFNWTSEGILRVWWGPRRYCPVESGPYLGFWDGVARQQLNVLHAQGRRYRTQIQIF